jgi:hypothetical protein
MTGDHRVNQFAAMRFKRFEGADLIRLHEPAVGDDIGCENGSKPALNARVCHNASPWSKSRTTALPGRVMKSQRRIPTHPLQTASCG